MRSLAFEDPLDAAIFWQILAARAHADAVAAIEHCAFRAASSYQRDAAHFAAGALETLLDALGSPSDAEPAA